MSTPLSKRSVKMSIECIFCDKFFISKYTLKNHQETNKKCLELQNKTNDKYICICNKRFSSKTNLQYHIDKCKSQNVLDLQKIIEDQNTIILDLKKNLTQNIICNSISEDMLKKHVNKILFDDLSLGIENLILYSIPILKNRYYIIDFIKNIFIFKFNGVYKIDTLGNDFITLIFKNYRQKIIELSNEIIEDGNITENIIEEQKIIIEGMEHYEEDTELKQRFSVYLRDYKCKIIT